MFRYDIINYLIKKYNYKSYLEIGVRDSRKCFDKIIVDKKTAVDPKFINKPNSENSISYEMTSDDFFKINNEKYDIIFIDGMHEDSYVYRDIENSLKFVNDNGYIILHDCNPIKESHQFSYDKYDGKSTWNGTVWKAFVRFRNNENLLMTTIDTDHGMGCIKKGKQKSLNIEDKDLCWEKFIIHKKEWLNLIPKQQLNLL